MTKKTDYGMKFSNSGNINNPDYTTDTKRLNIDLSNPEPLFGIKTTSGGTGINIALDSASTISEQLLVIPHVLTYEPQVYITLMLIAINGEAPGLLLNNRYASGTIPYNAGGSLYQDWIDTTVTATTVTINHHVQSYGVGTAGSSYTSVATYYNLQTKYLICNNTQSSPPPTLTS